MDQGSIRGNAPTNRRDFLSNSNYNEETPSCETSARNIDSIEKIMRKTEIVLLRTEMTSGDENIIYRI